MPELVSRGKDKAKYMKKFSIPTSNTASEKVP